MTQGSIWEYTEAVRGRYLRAGKKEKGRIPDEFTQVTGYHRKAAIRLLRQRSSSLGEFLHRVSALKSYEELKALISSGP